MKKNLFLVMVGLSCSIGSLHAHAPDGVLLKTSKTVPTRNNSLLKIQTFTETGEKITATGILTAADITAIRDQLLENPSIKIVDLSAAQLQNGVLPAQAFMGVKVDEIILPSNLSKIGYKAFLNASLNKLDLSVYPELSQIEFSAFGNLQLTEKNVLDLSSNNKLTHSPIHWDYRGMFSDYSGHVILPKKMTEIPNSAFNFFNGTFEYPENIVKIGNRAFSNYKPKADFVIPNSVTHIGELAFSLGEFENFTLPTSLQSIGFQAFSKTKMNKLDFSICPDLNQIGFSAFGNLQLTKKNVLDLSSNNKLTHSPIHWDYRGMFSDYSGHVILPKKMTEIPNSAFNFFNGTFEYPENIVKIGNRAFSNYKPKADFVIPNSVTHIGELAFSLGEFENFTLPTSLQSIGFQAFSKTKMNKLDFSICPDLNQIGFSAFGNLQLTEKNVLDLSSNNKLTHSPIHWDYRGMFSDYSGHVILPKKMTEIPNSAFSFFNGTFEYPESPVKIGNRAFLSYKPKKDFVIPNSVTHIEGLAFSLGEFENFTLPTSLQSIGSQAFSETKMNKLDFSACPDLNQIGFSAFGNLQLTEKNVLDLSSNNKLTHSPIHWDGRGMFSDYSGHVILPKKMTEIPNSAFSFFNGTFEYPESPVKIGNRAFLSYKPKKDFVIPNSVTHIGILAFSLGEFENFTLPTSLQSIGSQAFSETKMNKLDFSVCPDLNQIGNSAFGNLQLTKKNILDLSTNNKLTHSPINWDYRGMFSDYSGHVILPKKMTVIPHGAFSHYTGTFEFPEIVTEIGRGAFYYYKSSQIIKLPNTLKKLGVEVFGGVEFNDLTLPSSLTYIDVFAFRNAKIKKLISLAKEPPALNRDVFGSLNYQNCELIVPEGSKCLYGNREQWKNFYSESVKSCLEERADVISRGPNSYIFDIDLAKRENKGGLLIPVNKAYAAWLKNKYLQENIPQGKLSASLFWEDVKGVVKSVKLLPGTNPEESHIEVMINKARGKGNAVVAFHVGNTGTDKDPVYWSWHVWITDDPTQGSTYNNAKDALTTTFMDRNLGALGNSFLGHGWTRTGGLHYQWGRKDPFPPQRYPDGNVNYTFLNPVSNPENKSVVYNNSYINDHNTRTEITHTILEPGETPEENIKYAVQHPFHFISLKNERIDKHFYSWYTGKNGGSGKLTDLWAANDMAKASGGANYHNPELKSVFDPCPSGWRVPSTASRNGIHDSYSFQYSPWGGYPNNMPGNMSLSPKDYLGIKVYPGLGFDFNIASRYHIGKYSLTGRYLHAGGRLIYQDQNSESFIWSATLGDSQNYETDPYGSGGGFTFHLIANSNNQFDDYLVFPFEHPQNTVAQAVRCGRDPRATDLTDYPTFYVDARERDYTEGLDNPNTYLVKDKDTEINIPINKAYSVYNQYLTDHQWPTGNLSVNVYWTTNQNLVKNVSLEGIDETGTIKVDLNPQEKGNAVVSLHMGNNGNSLDPVLWSWHLWAPNGNPEDNAITYTTEEKYHKGRKNPEDNVFLAYNTESGSTPLTTTFMDRNLGALEFNVESDDRNVYEKTGGLYYQWGRKDPIPGFRNVGYVDYSYRGYNIFTGSNETGKIEYKTLSHDLYNKNHAKAVDFNKTKTTASALKLAAERPLDIFYHTSPKITWVPEIEYNKNLWGHAEKKSPFDPCPSGWRVPDFGYKGGNNSPWYKEGTYYDASQVKGNSGEGVMAPITEGNKHKAPEFGIDILNTYKGISFNKKDDYKLGQYPATGYLNFVSKLNGVTVTYPANVAVWSATMTGWDDIAAKAIYYNYDDESYIVDQKFNPSNGLNVRCAKDLPRFTEESIANSNKVTKIQKTELQRFSTITNEVKKGHFLYPNPVSDYLYIDTDNAVEYKIYNFSRNLVQQGKFVNKYINVSNLAPGIYVIQLMDKTNNQVYSVNITKK